MDGAVFSLICDAHVQLNALLEFLYQATAALTQAHEPLFTCSSHPSSYLTQLGLSTPTRTRSCGCSQARPSGALVSVRVNGRDLEVGRELSLRNRVDVE